MRPFLERVAQRSAALGTHLCLGVDPREEGHRDLSALYRETLELVERAATLACCVKPQLAFFELLGAVGLELLGELIDLSNRIDLPVLLDGKRGDIGSTARAYARAWISGSRSGCALTVHPYLGFEALLPFTETAEQQGGAVFALLKTSNPGNQDLQGQRLNRGGTLADAVAGELARLARAGAPVGAVVGATLGDELAHWREALPEMAFLLPGVGAQGAEVAGLAPAFPSGMAIVPISRAIQYPEGRADLPASLLAATRYRDAVEAVARRSAPPRAC